MVDSFASSESCVSQDCCGDKFGSSRLEELELWTLDSVDWRSSSPPRKRGVERKSARSGKADLADVVGSDPVSSAFRFGMLAFSLQSRMVSNPFDSSIEIDPF